MFYSPIRLIHSNKGISILTLIIIAAFIFAGFNAYAYFNPEFSLRNYSLLRFLGSYNDKTRIKDLQNIQITVERYYDDNGEYPASDGWCGRIVSVLYPEAKDALQGYFNAGGIHQDPAFRGTSKDYFYRREDRNTYVLMAVLENPPVGSKTYSYEKCHDWPGDDVYNYRLEGSR